MLFDHVPGNNMDEKEADSVEICHTGSDKSRYTLVVTMTASGVILPGFIIWRGLVKPPAIFKHQCSSNLVMHTSPSGTMDAIIMVNYFERIIKCYLYNLQRKSCLLILDEARAHNTPEIKQYLRQNGALPLWNVLWRGQKPWSFVCISFKPSLKKSVFCK